MLINVNKLNSFNVLTTQVVKEIENKLLKMRKTRIQKRNKQNSDFKMY